MNLSDFRKEYSSQGLHRSALKLDPIELFEDWFRKATELEVYEPNAIALSTVSESGEPTQRTVLLKAFDQRGFTFFTNYTSRKATQIEANQSVSLLFPWLTLERQIAIQGIARKISEKESLAYFKTRPRESQIGAWASDQSSIVLSRLELEEKLTSIGQNYEGKEIPLPPHWGGYRVEPKTIEFWQGGAGRVHDRFLYTLQSDNSWNIERLSP